jgi:hypothetical protein
MSRRLLKKLEAFYRPLGLGRQDDINCSLYSLFALVMIVIECGDG